MKRLKETLVACGLLVAGTVLADGYNRASLSINIDDYGYNKEFYGNDKDQNPSFTAGGMGLNYVHGFSLSKKLPMFLEVGGSINYNGHSWSNYEEDDALISEEFANLNLRIPVNFAWKFQLNSKHSLTPYTGINFKFNCLTQVRNGVAADGREVWSDWYSILKKSEHVDELDVWNVFQMGWQIGLNWGIKRFNIGVEWGYDFLPAYNQTIRIYDYKETFKVNTSSFKLSVGYSF